jgi:REP element-mobilizing transposase RayT
MLRGTNRQDLFHDDEDMYKMLEVIKQCTEIGKARVHAYCLMSNHLHLLMQCLHETDSETLSQIVKRIGVRYAAYFNFKYDRVGAVFQERFKSEPVETEKYFLSLMRYIHQNPVKAGISKSPDQYAWSSYGAYVGKSDFVYKDLADLLLGGQYESYMNAAEEITCLELDEVKQRLTDMELSAKIADVLGMHATQVGTLDRNARNRALQMIVAIDGATYRQISRLTGISMGLISSAVNT